MANKAEQFCNQAASTPIDSVQRFNQYLTNLEKLVEWDSVCILTDENNRNNVVLLADKSAIVATLRLCLLPNETLKCITNLIKEGDSVEYRCIQGQNISSEQLSNIAEISLLWAKAAKQGCHLPLNKIEELFIRFEDERKKKGRGKGFSTNTKNTVWRESFSRCMFTGCGEKLDNDELSGVTGNFAYLAHNVASSEQGERGIVLLSEELSDDPSNVLLLCDKHHRLIDKVAASDYTASRLSAMKEEFSLVANSLLDGLKYQPIPVYAVLWPVNSQTISPPSQLQIANCLSTIKRRIHQQVNILSDNEELLIENPDIFWQLMPNVINTTADKILQQIRPHDFNAALFAFGPSSALIGLGAKLGNKNYITPMLRYRNEIEWTWPKEAPVGEFYDVEGLDDLSSHTDFIVNLALTAEPESLKRSSQAVNREFGAQVITVKAKREFMGSGAISHPQDGKQLTTELQVLFHKLLSDFGAKQIHLFTCASNAACFFIGQAYDKLHPDVIIYDFEGDAMVPRLRLSSENHKCIVSSN